MKKYRLIYNVRVKYFEIYRRVSEFKVRSHLHGIKWCRGEMVKNYVSSLCKIVNTMCYNSICRYKLSTLFHNRFQRRLIYFAIWNMVMNARV